MFWYVGKLILYFLLWMLIIMFLSGIVVLVFEEIKRYKLNKKAGKLFLEKDMLEIEGNILKDRGELKEGNKRLKGAKDKDLEYNKLLIEITDRENHPPVLYSVGVLGVIILSVGGFICLIIYIPFLFKIIYNLSI